MRQCTHVWSASLFLVAIGLCLSGCGSADLKEEAKARPDNEVEEPVTTATNQPQEENEPLAEGPTEPDEKRRVATDTSPQSLNTPRSLNTPFEKADAAADPPRIAFSRAQITSKISLTKWGPAQPRWSSREFRSPDHPQIRRPVTTTRRNRTR